MIADAIRSAAGVLTLCALIVVAGDVASVFFPSETGYTATPLDVAGDALIATILGFAYGLTKEASDGR